MIDFIWNIHQQHGISEAKADAAGARQDVTQQTGRVRELEFSLHRMALASQAMWELLRSRLDITEPELLAKIEEIDLRDGKKDQRMAPQIISCPKCSRNLSTKNSRCIYCGTNVPKPHVFQ